MIQNSVTVRRATPIPLETIMNFKHVELESPCMDFPILAYLHFMHQVGKYGGKITKSLTISNFPNSLGIFWLVVANRQCYSLSFLSSI